MNQEDVHTVDVLGDPKTATAGNGNDHSRGKVTRTLLDQHGNPVAGMDPSSRTSPTTAPVLSVTNKLAGRAWGRL